MKWTNRIIAICLIGASFVLYPYTEKFPGSAAEFPRLVLGLIIFLSFLMLVRSFVPSLMVATSGRGSESPAKMIRPICAFSATAAAVFAMRFIGFFPAMAGLGLALLVILNARRPLVFIAAMIGLFLFVFLVFQLLLGVPLNSSRLWGG